MVSAHPALMNGSSAGFVPSQVSKMVVATIVQNMIFLIGQNWFLLIFFFIIGIAINTMIDEISVSTPPSLFGTDRNIVYANKKYHSGWMWLGVINGLAGEKFSGSISMNGFIIIIAIIVIIRLILNMSFIEKYGWKGIFLMFLFVPSGLLDPVWWRNIR